MYLKKKKKKKKKKIIWIIAYGNNFNDSFGNVNSSEWKMCRDLPTNINRLLIRPRKITSGYGRK